MRKWISCVGAILIFALASAGSAQQFSSSVGTAPKTTVRSTTSTPAFFMQTMQRPNLSPFAFKAPVPQSLNLFNLVPSFPNLHDTMLMRNIIGQQSGFTIPALPKQATPPPKKK